MVEHNLAKVGVADSSSVFRSQDPDLRLEWWNGRHEGLKIPWPTTAVRVQVPLRVHVSPICYRGTFYGLRIFSYGSGEAISPFKFPIELRFGGIFFCDYGICGLVGRGGAAVRGWTSGGVSPDRVARHRRREDRHQSSGAGLDECIAIDGGSGIAYTVW